MANDKINAVRESESDIEDEGDFYFHSSLRSEPFCFHFVFGSTNLRCLHTSHTPHADDDDNNGIICTVFLCFCVFYFENVIIFSALGLLAFILMRRDVRSFSFRLSTMHHDVAAAISDYKSFRAKVYFFGFCL